MHAYWLNSRYSIFLARAALCAAMLGVCLPSADAAGKVARVRVISVSLNEQTEEAKAFRLGLRNAGYTEGRDLTVELKTAKALGITIPQSILLQADEVIR